MAGESLLSIGGGRRRGPAGTMGQKCLAHCQTFASRRSHHESTSLKQDHTDFPTLADHSHSLSSCWSMVTVSLHSSRSVCRLCWLQ